jgi:hypothetical protein
MPDDLVRSATGKVSLAPPLLTKLTNKAAAAVAEHYTAAAPSTALLGALSANNPGLDTELSALADAVKTEHTFLINQLSTAVLKAANTQTELIQTAFESREKSEELGLDPKKPFENRVAFLERMAMATHRLVADAQELGLQMDDEDGKLEHALRAAHFVVQDALGDAEVRRRTVEDAVEAARKLARDREDEWSVGGAMTTSVQGKNGAGAGRSSKSKKKDKDRGKGAASASGQASCCDTIGSSPPILPATNTASADSAASASSFGIQTGGTKTSPVRHEPARTFPSAPSAFTHHPTNPPRASVRRPPTKRIPGDRPFSFGASSPPASDAFSITSGLGADIPFGPGSTIPYSMASTAVDYGFPKLRVPPGSAAVSAYGAVSVYSAASVSVRNPLGAAAGGGREERGKEKGGEVVESPTGPCFRD